VQEFDNSMRPVDYIALITSKTIYFFNKKFVLQKRIELKFVESVVLIKTNASIFSINIVN